MNKIQKDILYKLRYQSFLSYNKLWGKEGDSAKFAYHLRSLEKKELVEKNEKGYRLTLDGIKFIDYLTVPSPQPIIVIVVVPKINDKVLVRVRERYPFKDY